MDRRKIICGLCIKLNGDFRKVLEALESKELLDYDELYALEAKCESKYITVLDPIYPRALFNIATPPFVLFYKGDISLLNDYEKSVAVIGTRKPSEYGETHTRRIVSKLVENDITIVSGLATGIDGIAHAQALKEYGKTIAVLGSGVNYVYPSDNKRIYDLIVERGLVISEYPNSIEPQPEFFIARNRIIAGVSKGVLVTEAFGPRSGTLTTVRFALDFNRDVMCVPKRVEENSICNLLIKQGAFLVENGLDVLKVMSGEKLLYK